jgi:nucleoside-diphosphate-sugar epimerase
MPRESGTVKAVNRTLVIGGTRNLGPGLVSALMERGDRVTVLNRGVTPGAAAAGVERLAADRSDPAALSAALGGREFDLVVDTTLYSGADAGVLAELLSGRAGRLVFWSTGQVYLVRTGLKPPYREEDYDGPLMGAPGADRASDQRNWDYGAQKRAAEDRLRAAAASGAFELAVLRMPMIHSVRDHYGRIAAYVHRITDGGPILVPAEGSLAIRHVFGEDVITATLLASTAAIDREMAVNIGQDGTVTLEEMLHLIATHCDHPLRLKQVPRAELDRRGLLPACSPFSDVWMSALDNTRAVVELGMSFTPVASWLPRLVTAARARPAADVPGYASRAAELLLP